MLEEVKKILKHGRAGVKVTGNGVANFVMYPVSVEEMAKQICHLFEPKKKILGRKETLRLIHDTEEELFGMTESKPETDYNIGDKGMTTGNESYGTLPKPAGRDASDWGLFTESKPKSRLLTRKDLQDKFPGAYQAIDGVWYYANEKSEYVPIPKQVKIQDAKTASIQEEHIAHLIDDVINLEKKLKEKDAECRQRVKAVEDTLQKLHQEAQDKWMNDMLKLEAECQKQLADCIFMQKAKCQARVERIYEILEMYGLGEGPSIPWEEFLMKMNRRDIVVEPHSKETLVSVLKYALKKQEGVK